MTVARRSNRIRVVVGEDSPFMQQLLVDSLSSEINPEIKVLILTGYTADESVQELLKEGAVGLIEKPFDLDDFTETVRRRISSDRTPAGPPTSP